MEHWLLLGIGCSLAAAVAGLIFVRPRLDPSLAVPVRFLLATAASCFGAVLPGPVLRLRLDGAGVIGRAAGAAAFFAAVWFGSPDLIATTLHTAAATAASAR